MAPPIVPEQADKRSENAEATQAQRIVVVMSG
jgi:hypothetical protein